MPNKAFPDWYFPGVMEHTPDPTGEGDMSDEQDEEPGDEPDEDPDDVPGEPDAVKKARRARLKKLAALRSGATLSNAAMHKKG